MPIGDVINTLCIVTAFVLVTIRMFAFTLADTGFCTLFIIVYGVMIFVISLTDMALIPNLFVSYFLTDYIWYWCENHLEIEDDEQ